jgi:hypothetical protein
LENCLIHTSYKLIVFPGPVRGSGQLTAVSRAVTSPPPSEKLALKLLERSCPSVLLVACRRRRRCASSRSIRLGILEVLVVLGIFCGIP